MPRTKKPSNKPRRRLSKQRLQSEIVKILEQQQISGAGFKILPEGPPDAQLAEIILFSIPSTQKSR